ncbi:MAG: ABC transporter permease [Variovorax sp.]
MIREYREIVRRRALIDHMARGHLRASVHRTVLGSAWYLLIPAIQIAIYYALVVVIFQRGAGLDYFLLLSMGIIHYSILLQALSNASSAIHGNAAILLQIKIEPLVLVAATFVKSLRTSLAGVVIFALLLLVLRAPLTPRLIAYPLILLLWIWFCWSMTILVATAAAYSRDLDKVIPFVAQILMYLSPVIFSVNFFPPGLYDFFLLNPVAALFALFQWCFVGAALPPFHVLALLPVTLGLLFYGAHVFYASARRGLTKIL